MYLNPNAINSIKLAVSSVLSVQKRGIVYLPIYKGPFDYKRTHTKAYKFPFNINKSELEEEFNEINQIRKLDIKEVSPFHLVWRYKSMRNIPWHEKFTLAHLGLHHMENNIRTIVPNTPHFNKLLFKVKHMIKLIPISFPDGVPTEKDVGCVKVDIHTGVMRVNDSFKMTKERLDSAKSDDIYYGRYLREYLKWASGLFSGLPSSDVIQFDGNHFEDFERQVRNANKHQHKFYQDKKDNYWH